MRSVRIFLLTFFLAVFPGAAVAQKGSFGEVKQLQSPQSPAVGFMIHGGAGVIAKGSMTPEKEKEYRAKLQEVVLAGYKALQDGKSSVEAVELAIRMMEDSALFNAGKGAVANADGKSELDASIMDGKTLTGGAVAGLHRVKNPISLARVALEKSPHLMIVGEGAEKFAREQKIEIVEEIAKGKTVSEPGAIATGPLSTGAVGAVALDKKGNIAAGSSSGGVANTKYGRIGDTAIIGAGIYANNETCGVSGMGWGDYFSRLTVARDISSLMEYQAQTVQSAADRVIRQKVKKLGGMGGVIAMDKFGNMAISFNTEGMYRAYINADGKAVVEIF